MEPMTKRLEIRLTEEEWKKIGDKMSEAGVANRSAFIRKMAIDGYIIRMDLSGVQEVIRLLRINSNNLNQYAKKANETGCIYEDDIRDLQVQQAKLWQEMRKILKELGGLQT